jgi:hypothetical protein
MCLSASGVAQISFAVVISFLFEIVEVVND